MAGKVGIREVAQMAGVSAGTVSKVLKDYPGISAETRRRVMAVIEKTGYIPNSVASALSSKKNNRIALYIYINDRTQQIDEINMQLILGAYDKARTESLELVTVFNTSIESLSSEDTARYFHSMHADTLIVFGLNKNDAKIHDLARGSGLRMVLVDSVLEGDQVSTVMVDHEKAQYETAARICAEGDRVLYLKGKEDAYVTDMRLKAMERLAKERKLRLRVEDGEFSEARAYEIVKGLKEEYDAIVCASDLMAIGAKRALPKDSKVKISGFDGIRLMEYVADDVITCRQDFYTIGAEAVEAAKRLRSGGKGEDIRVPYTVGFIRR